MEEKFGTCVAAGHICLDIIPDLGGQPDFLAAILPGQLLPIGAPTIATGGSVSNTGQALHKLGIPTRLMGKVGDDSFGREVLARLGAVDEALVQEMRSLPGEHTSYSIIISPSDADRVFLHSTGANDTFGPEDVDYTTLKKTDLFHFGYPTAMARMYADNGVELAELMKRAKETGITTSLDTSMFDRHGIVGRTDWEIFLARTMPYVDIFMPSLDELLLMLDPEQPASMPDPLLCRELSNRLLEIGAGVVVLKQGENGQYMRTLPPGTGHDLGRAFAGADEAWYGRELWAPAFKVPMVGTTGAGDCAAGGFLAALLRGLGPEEALQMSAAAGACNVEAADATSGVRSWEETEARIAAGWRQHELALPGWTYNKKTRLWVGPMDGCYA
jgi:sugar/nucleoside kinase (ribokinase family)